MSSPVVRIAVVEDDPSVRKGLGRLLRSYGFEVRLFESAEEFLDTFEDPLPGCLILDIHLGRMSGIDLLAELKARGISIPTVVITGREVGEDLAAALRYGVKGQAIPCLLKPFRGESLQKAVEQVLKAAT